MLEGVGAVGARFGKGISPSLLSIRWEAFVFAFALGVQEVVKPIYGNYVL